MPLLCNEDALQQRRQQYRRSMYRMSPLFSRKKQPSQQEVQEAPTRARGTAAGAHSSPTVLARAGKERKETAQGHTILLRPWISEKALRLAERKVYVFEVAMSATKAEVAKAVEEVYGVQPRRVTIIRRAPRKEMSFRHRRGQRHVRGYKKAMVFLKEGDSITLV